MSDDDWAPEESGTENRRFGGYDEDVISGAHEDLEDDESLEDKRIRRALERKKAVFSSQPATVLETMKESIVASAREMRIAEKKAGDDIRATVGDKTVAKHFQPQTQRLLNRINLGNSIFGATGVDLSQSAASSIKEQMRKEGGAAKAPTKDRADRATVEQVLDPRTRMILFKFINNGFFNEINGCISTGKEANVYHAVRTEPMRERKSAVGAEEDESNTNEDATSQSNGNTSIDAQQAQTYAQQVAAMTGPMEMAVKIFKTSILVFKDRDQYVTGEFRFRRGYSRHNPRKMVRVWAEKEMRNLVRMHTAGIPCPQPLTLRSHVLIMGFIGKQGWAAPRLKDAELDAEQFKDAYGQVVKHMRTLYNKCRLVHADLSEYNILYYKKTCYIIDVGQAVENDHPSALEFLRRDIAHINLYFYKNDVLTMSNRELFDFVTDATLKDENVEEYLERAQERVSKREDEKGSEETKEKEEIEDKIFLSSFIPRTMDEVAGEDFMLDRYKVLTTGDSQSVYYRKVLGLNPTLSGADKKPDLLKTEDDYEPVNEEENAKNAAMLKAAIESYRAQLREGGYDDEEDEEWDEDEEYDEWDEDEEYDEYDEDEELEEDGEDDFEDEETDEKDSKNTKNASKTESKAKSKGRDEEEDEEDDEEDDDDLPALIPLKKGAAKRSAPVRHSDDSEEDDEEDSEEETKVPTRTVAKMVSFRLPGRSAATVAKPIPKSGPKKAVEVDFSEEEDEEDEEYDEEDDEDDFDGEEDSEDDGDDEDDEIDSEEDEKSDDEDAPQREKGKPRARRSELSKEERKAHKAQVKLENAEKRKTKIPKHVKKRAKATKGRKK